MRQGWECASENSTRLKTKSLTTVAPTVPCGLAISASKRISSSQISATPFETLLLGPRGAAVPSALESERAQEGESPSLAELPARN